GRRRGRDAQAGRSRGLLSGRRSARAARRRSRLADRPGRTSALIRHAFVPAASNGRRYDRSGWWVRGAPRTVARSDVSAGADAVLAERVVETGPQVGRLLALADD